MSRKLDNWLQSYIEYTENTESAPVYHRWMAISMIAAALQRKIHFNLGRLKVMPNLYIVLCAEPGVTRKTQAINWGLPILTEVESIVISADAITPQALLDDLEECASQTNMPDGSTYTHNSLSVYSGEFEVFLGQKKENSKMIIYLTDLFDCKDIPFKYRTKHSGSNKLDNTFFNIYGATTPESLADCLPSKAIGGGLGSRIIFVWADKKGKKVAIPEGSAHLTELKRLLISDLHVISRMVGEYSFTAKSKIWWEDFYDKYEERDPNRLCKDPSFVAWYSRKPMLIIKTAMSLAAAESSGLYLEITHFEKAREMLENIEPNMSKAFIAVGRSEITAEVAAVRGIIERHQKISEKKLLQMIWRDVDAAKFDPVISTLLKSDTVHRDFYRPGTQVRETWYYWGPKPEK